MSRLMKFTIGIIASLSLSAGAAMAQGYRDAGAKARGEFGTSFYSSGARAMTAYRAPTYDVAPAPMAAPAAPQIAQAPSTARSFSVEPSQGTQVAPAAPQVIRSYSYTPSAPVYRAPSRSRSDVPTYLLPKTDTRKYGG